MTYHKDLIARLRIATNFANTYHDAEAICRAIDALEAPPAAPAQPEPVNARLLEALEKIAKNDPFSRSSAGVIARAAIAEAQGKAGV